MQLMPKMPSARLNVIDVINPSAKSMSQECKELPWYEFIIYSLSPILNSISNSKYLGNLCNPQCVNMNYHHQCERCHPKYIISVIVSIIIMSIVDLGAEGNHRESFFELLVFGEGTGIL